MSKAASICVVLVIVGCRGMRSEQRPVQVMSPNQGERFWFFHEHPDELGSGGELQVFMDGHIAPEAQASFAKFTLGVGGELPIHRHEKTEEIAYILSGEGLVTTVDDDGSESEIDVSQGFVWYNPPGAWHAIRNTGSSPLSMVFATIPNEKKGLMSFFRRIGVRPGREATQLPPDEFRRIAEKHDLILRGPE